MKTTTHKLSRCLLSALLALLLAVFASNQAEAITFSNPAPIAIPAVGSPNQIGPGAPSPSLIAVAGLSGNITDLTVSLFGLTHSIREDVDLLLVGPTGLTVLLMSDISPGTGGGFNNLNFTFMDGAPSLPAGFVPIMSGTYSPTNYNGNDGANDIFTGAPAGPYGSSLAAFIGTNGNGAWQLFSQDDATGDIGQISGGWSLNVTTAGAAGVPETGSTLLLLSLAVGGIFVARRKVSIE